MDAVGAPHVGDRTDKELIAAFCDKIAELNPQLVTFNGNSFDLPVLRYRAMVRGGICAGPMRGRAYARAPTSTDNAAPRSLQRAQIKEYGLITSSTAFDQTPSTSP